MNTYPHRRASVFPSDEVISCAACDELLDAYLDAELANINVKYYYSKVWRHLQSCRCCAAYHDWLYTVLSKRPSASPFSRSYRNQFDLSFLPFRQPHPTPVSAAPDWDTYLRPCLFGEPFLLRISFSPEYLQRQFHLFAPDSHGRALAAEHPPSPCLLLKQLVPLPEQELVIKVIAYPLSVRLSLVRLQATLSVTSFSATKLQAQLQWGKIERIAKITDTGEADLGPVSLAPTPDPAQAINRSDENIFAITFESTP